MLCQVAAWIRSGADKWLAFLLGWTCLWTALVPTSLKFGVKLVTGCEHLLGVCSRLFCYLFLLHHAQAVMGVRSTVMA
jgi:hypothetical protein